METLTVPAQATARHPQALLEPKRLRAWLAELPLLLDPGTAAQSLLRQLQLLVRTPDPLPRYEQLLDSFRPAVAQLLEQWFALLEASGTKERAQRKFDDLKPTMQQLLTEIAFAEKRQIRRNLDRRSSDQLAVDLHAAMHALSLKILLAMLNYQPVPMSSWREMLSLYDIAAEYGVVHEAVESESTRTRNVEQGLFAGLLIQLADPYRLAPTEMWRLYQRLAERVHLVRILPLTECDQGVRVDLNGRLAPLANVRDPNAARGGRQLCLDLTALSASMGGTDSELLSLEAWHRQERAAPRNARSGSYVVYRGLQAIHHVLQREDGPPPNAEDDPFAHRRFECRIQDHSSGGAALVSSDPRRTELKVGDLLICQTRSVAKANRWIHFVAEVRRLMASGGNLRLGVQKITGRLVPGEVRSNVGSLGHRDGLLRLQESDPTPELLAATNVCTIGAHVNLRTASYDYELQVLALRERNPSHDRALVRILQRRPRPRDIEA